MKHIINIIEIALLFIVAVLIVILFFPWSEPEVNINIKTDIATSDITLVPVESENNVIVPPEQIARLFGWAPVQNIYVPPKEEPEMIEEPQVINATWIAFTGTITRADVIKKYYFKNKQNNTIIQLSLNETEQSGWKLLKITEDSFLLENDGKQFLVKK
jgi:hypothetical protein